SEPNAALVSRAICHDDHVAAARIAGMKEDGCRGVTRGEQPLDWPVGQIEAEDTSHNLKPPARCRLLRRVPKAPSVLLPRRDSGQAQRRVSKAQGPKSKV